MMNRLFKTYVLIWAIAFGLFQLICFVTPSPIAGISKFTGSFWIGYIFITVAFVGQLGCGYLALKSDHKTKLFYNIPLIRISYIGLLMTLLVGGVIMLFPMMPSWIGILAGAVVLGFTSIAVVTAKTSADLVEDIDNKIQEQTYFVKDLTVDVDRLVARAQTPQAKAACKKVYEAARYADPMSSGALAGVEYQITETVKQLEKAVLANDDTIEKLADEIVILIGDRNQRCKLIK